MLLFFSVINRIGVVLVRIERAINTDHEHMFAYLVLLDLEKIISCVNINHKIGHKRVNAASTFIFLKKNTSTVRSLIGSDISQRVIQDPVSVFLNIISLTILEQRNKSAFHQTHVATCGILLYRIFVEVTPLMNSY